MNLLLFNVTIKSAADKSLFLGFPTVQFAYVSTSTNQITDVL